MDNYSKSLFLISLDHYYWMHETLFALRNTCSHSGKLNSHYWLITVDYTEWLYPYFVDFQCCIRKHWKFPNMSCFIPTKKGRNQKQVGWEEVDLYFLNHITISEKHTPNDAFFFFFQSRELLFLVKQYDLGSLWGWEFSIASQLRHIVAVCKMSLSTLRWGAEKIFSNSIT